MRSSIRLSALALAISLTSSCSFVDEFDSFHASPDGSTGPLTITTFLPLFFDGLCSKSIRCESKSGIGGLLELYCHPGLQQEFLSRSFGTISGFDPVVAQRCLDGLGSIDCSLSNTLYVSDCESFLHGSASIGQSCLSDFSCATGRCEELPGTCGTVCVDKGNAGAACTSSNDECDTPLRCRGSTCQTAGDIGQACEQADDCMPLMWCHNVSHTCQALPNAGDACLIDGTTGYADPCRGSLVCDLMGAGPGRTCQPGLTLGATCTSDARCAPGHRCRSGTCHLISQPGGSCVSLDDCPSAYECVAEVCVPYAQIGESCSPTLPCFRGSCVGNVCTWLADGATCDGSNGFLGGQCSGYCNTTTSTFVCAARGGVGAACNGTYDDEACQDGLGCVDGGGGVYSCQTCN